MPTMPPKALGALALAAVAAGQGAPGPLGLQTGSWPKTIALVPQPGFPSSGLCMDLAGENVQDGTPIQAWECNGKRAQLWIFDGGSYRIAYGGAPNMCVDAGDMKAGSYLQLWECNDLPQQKWYFDGTTHTISVYGTELCVFAVSQQGNPLMVTSCNQDPQQMFNIWYGTTFRMAWDTQKCLDLDLAGGQSYMGAVAQISQCDSSRPTQQWIHTDDGGPIIFGGNYANPAYCLDMHDMKEGNQLMIWPCNGYAQQKWGYDSNMMTLYAATGQSICLDLRGGFDAPGTAAIVYTCNGCWNQQWLVSHLNWHHLGANSSARSGGDSDNSTAARLADCPPMPGQAASSSIALI